MASYSQAVNMIKAGLRCATPIMLWGPPGIGKSSLVHQVASDLKIGLIDERATTTEPVDWRGVPFVKDGITNWAIPEFLPVSGSGILFLDELSAAAPSVQVALYQLLLDRKLGKYRLPDGWHVIGAGNRAEDRAVANRMSSAMANRMIHVTLTADVDEWLNWFWANPLSDMAETVGFFISFRREALFAFDPTAKDLAFPTPRSWEMVAKLTAVGEGNNQEMISGTIGAGMAAEYLAFCRIYQSLPNLDSILIDPDTAPVPAEPSARAATVAGLAKKAAPSNIGAILKYCARLSHEMEFMAVHLCQRTSPDVINTKAMAQWMAANNKFLMAH